MLAPSSLIHRGGRSAKVLSQAVVFALITLLVPVIGNTAPALGAPDPGQPIGRAALAIESLGRTLGDLGTLDELNEPLPLAAFSPRELLRLDEVFDATLGVRMRSIGAGADATALEAAISSASTILDTPALDVDYTAVSVGNGNNFDVDFTIHVQSVETLPLQYFQTESLIPMLAEGDEDLREEDLVVQLLGNDVQITTTFDTQISLNVKGNDGNPLTSVSFNTTPLVAINASAPSTPIRFDAVFGFAAIDVTGNTAFDIDWSMDLIDPDGQAGLSRGEWESTIAVDLSQPTGTNPSILLATSTVAASLTLTPLISGGLPGSLTWTDLAAGPVPAFADLEPFRKMTPDDVLSGVGQFAAAIAGAEASGDVALPLLAQRVSDAYSPAEDLIDFVSRQGEAAVLCGKTDTTPPTGAYLPGDTWYCQAYTAIEAFPGSVVWSMGSNATSDATVGLSPTENVTITGTAMQPDVTVTFDEADPEGGLDIVHVAEPRFLTDQDLLADLQNAFSGATATIVLTYDPATSAIKYDLDVSKDPAPISAELVFDNALRPGTNLVGLQPKTNTDDDATLDAGTIALDTAFGIHLVDLEQLTDVDAPTIVGDLEDERFFVAIDNAPGQSEFQLTSLTAAPSTAAFEMTGTIGALAVDAISTGFSIQSTATPAITVDIEPSTAGIAGNVNWVPVREILTDLDERVTTAFNLQLTGGVDVAAGAGVTFGASSVGHVDYAMNPFTPTSDLVIAPDAPFTDNLKPFDVLPTVEGTSTQVTAATTLEDSAADFTTALGFTAPAGTQVAATLINTGTGGSCFSFEVTSATSLTCLGDLVSPPAGAVGLSGGVSRDAAGVILADSDGEGIPDNNWNPGDGYQVRGDPEAVAVLVGQTIYDIANRFDGYDANDYMTSLPLVGLTPADMLPQWAKLRDASGILVRLYDAGPLTGTHTAAASSTSVLTDDNIDFLAAGVEPGGSLLKLDGSGATVATCPVASVAQHTLTCVGSLTGAASFTQDDAYRYGAPLTLQDLETSLANLTGASVTFAFESSLAHPSGTSVPHLRVDVDPSPASFDQADPIKLRLELTGDAGTEDVELTGGTGQDPGLTLAITSDVAIRFAVPLALTVPASAVTVLDGTGVTQLDVVADGTEIDLEGSFAGLAVQIGGDAAQTGTHRPLPTSVVSGTADMSRSESGTHTAATSTTVLTDAAQDFSASGVLTGGTLTNTTDGSTCTVNAVGVTTLTCAAALTGGTENDFDTGDAYTYAYESPSATVLRDPGATFSATDTAAGKLLTNITDGVSCVIASSNATSITCAGPLPGSNTWDSGDQYEVTSGNRLRDPGANFDKIGIEPRRDVITNITDNSTCQVTTVISGSELECDGLTGGTENDFDDGDEYSLGAGKEAHLDASYTLLGAAPKLLDDEGAVPDEYMASLAGSLNGTSNNCGGTLDGHVCARLNVSDLATREFYGAVKFTFDFDLAGTETIPDALKEAASLKPLDWALLPESLVFLSPLVGDLLDGFVQGTEVALVGPDLDATGVDADHPNVGVDGRLDLVGLALSDVGAEITDATTVDVVISTLTSQLTTELDRLAPDVIHGLVTVSPICGGIPCPLTETAGDVEDIRIDVKIGGNVTMGASGDPNDPTKGCATNCGTETSLVPFELGLSAIPVQGSGDLESTVGWTFQLSFGLDRDRGPYLGLNSGTTPELVVGAKVQFPDGVCNSAFPTESVPDYGVDFSQERCLDGSFGLFQASMYDGTGALPDAEADWGGAGDRRHDRTRLDLLTEVDLAAPAGSDVPTKLDLFELLEEIDESATTVDADANFDVFFQSLLVPGAEALPAVRGTVHGVYDSDAATPFTLLEYRNIELSSGSFFDQFLTPIVEEVQEFTKPLQPVADTVSAPIPVISDVSVMTGNPPVTLLSLFDEVSGINDLSLLKRLAGFIKFANGLDVSGGSVWIGLGPKVSADPSALTSAGGFKVPTENVSSGPCGQNVEKTNLKQAKDCSKKKTTYGFSGNSASVTKNREYVKQLSDCPASGCTGKELARTVSASAGASITGVDISFPFLNDSSEIYGMLLGVDAVLVRVDFGTLAATAGISVSWGPFMAGPVPVAISVGGTVTLSGRFAMGFDTRGVRAALDGTGNGLIDGIFIDDLDATGKDVPEIKLVATITLGVSVSVLVFKVGLEGGVTLTISLDLVDPNGDGRLRIDEIEAIAADNILCLFEAKGTLEFFLNFFVEIDLGFWSKKWTYELWRLKPPLELFKVNCTPPVPEPANVVGAGEAAALHTALGTTAPGLQVGDLVINAGSQTLRNARNFKKTEEKEKITVRQLEPESPGGTKVEVEVLGAIKEYTVGAGRRVVIATDTRNDAILFEDGVTDDGVTITFTIDTWVSGGAGDDRIQTGDGNDVVFGDGDRDVIKVGKGNDKVDGGAGNDSIDGGAGNDVLFGGPNNDRVNGGPGRDLLRGDAGSDNLSGGPGLNANLAAKQAQRRFDRDPTVDKAAIQADIQDLADLIIGGDDKDDLQGHFGDDYLFGDNSGLAYDAVGLQSQAPITAANLAAIDVDASCATAGTGSGQDRLDGEAGDDFLFGGPDDDELTGSKGSDILCGNDGDDLLEGDSATGVAANDDLRGGNGDDRMFGRMGDDRFDGGPGNDFVVGAEGDDRMEGGTGADVLLPGEGNDIAVGDVGRPDGSVNLALITAGSQATGEVTLGTVADTGSVNVCSDVVGIIDGEIDVNGDGVVDATDDGYLEGLAVVDGLLDLNGSGAGDAEDNGIIGDVAVSAGRLDIDGSGGITDADDGLIQLFVFNGTDNADCINGDVGNDALFGSGGGDVINGDAGADYIEGNDGADLIHGGQDDDDILGGSGADEVFGDSGIDTLDGDAGPDIMWGGLDDDIMRGGTGNDEMHGQAGNDRMEGNQDSDTMYGETDDDNMIGGTSVAGTRDAGDTMYGGEGVDVMLGDNGTIDTGTRAFTRFDDTTTNDAADDAVSGDDTMYGDEAADVLIGQGGNDTMYGDDQTPVESMLHPLADADYMEGNAGSDTMYGHAGDDVMLGGSSTAGVVDENVAGVGDTMAGGSGSDTMAGDNASLPFDGSTAPIQLFDVATTTVARALQTSGDDDMHGDGAADLMFGQGGDDTMLGGGGNDYMEGNDGRDTMSGEDGDDDMIGGGSADDGIVDGTRVGIDLLDVGETDMYGGDGVDWMTGDNARIDRNFKPAPAVTEDMITLFDVETVTTGASPGTGGGDRMHGDEMGDRMFGQSGNDEMFGGGADDYMEGNNGQDTMWGEAGNDDMIGGGSANDEATAPGTGRIDADRTGDELLDAGELVMRGGLGQDWITGDNAIIDRNIPSLAPADVVLFDVETDPGAAIDDRTSGGDIIFGDEDADRIFGQGNGSQPDSQADPNDSLDNDGDHIVDEDGGSWLGDVIFGDGTSEAPTDGDDYVEGNHGADLIYGAGGDDDLIGGGSAADGVITPLTRVGDGLVDGRDTIHGGSGMDFVAGDNARIDRGGTPTGLTLGTDRSVQLFDVNSSVAATSGGDYLAGNSGADVMFGQGNGAQSADQADPNDGVDNDHDGTESGDPGSYDCEDGVDNDDDTFTDEADPDCAAAIDEDVTDWGGDTMLGGTGDDYMEGNHGSDWMIGGEGEDDMVGGGSSASGAIVPSRDGRGLNDGHDTMSGNDEDDVMAGDNATINRNRVGNDWERLTGVAGFDMAVRITEMPHDPVESAGAYGDDYMTGDEGDDEMYGQLGSDFMVAGSGDDAVIGDLGQVTTNLLGDGINDPSLDQVIGPNQPFFGDTVYLTGTLLRETVLFNADTADGGVGGADRIFGFDGRDSIHGGPGDDLINGDGDGILVPSVDDPSIILVEDPDPTTIDDDGIFGGDGNDIIWGGRSDDRVFGGHGDDYLDVRPRVAAEIEGVTLPADPAEWLTYGEGENYQGFDFLYGGWDQDALQANVAGPGPSLGDRLADWVGAYNVYYLCPANYGEYVITRSPAPSIRSFMQDVAEALGADRPANPNSSGFREVGMVMPQEAGDNSSPIHPDHPGHFTCEGDSNNTTPGANEPPDATITSPVAPVAITEGDTVDFAAAASDPEGGGVDYLWNFGDPAIPDSPLPAPSVVFATAGTYTVTLTVSDSEGLADPSPATIEIVVDPSGLPTVTVEATDPDADESGATGTFTFTRTGDTTVPLTVYFTPSGTATAGDDYLDVLGTSVTIAIGDLDASVTVTPDDDLDGEGPETVILTIDNDGTYKVGGANAATVTIADDDAAPPAVYRAIAESTGDGTVTGDSTATIGSDDVAEAIQEQKRGSRSKLSHTWTFDLTTAGTRVELTIEASEDSSIEDFAVAYSTDGSSWTDVLTISGATDTVQTAVLPVGAGPVYVRVTDTDRTKSETVLDTVLIDDLFIKVIQ